MVRGGRTWWWLPSRSTVTWSTRPWTSKPKSGRPLKRLRNVGENPVVTMLADHYSEDWETLWWVRADGRAAILTGQQEMAAPLRLLTDRYWQYRQAPPTGPVLAVTVERWSGWSGARAD